MCLLDACYAAFKSIHGNRGRRNGNYYNNNNHYNDDGGNGNNQNNGRQADAYHTDRGSGDAQQNQNQQRNNECQRRVRFGNNNNQNGTGESHYFDQFSIENVMNNQHCTEDATGNEKSWGRKRVEVKFTAHCRQIEDEGKYFAWFVSSTTTIHLTYYFHQFFHLLLVLYYMHVGKLTVLALAKPSSQSRFLYSTLYVVQALRSTFVLVRSNLGVTQPKRERERNIDDDDDDTTR